MYLRLVGIIYDIINTKNGDIYNVYTLYFLCYSYVTDKGGSKRKFFWGSNFDVQIFCTSLSQNLCIFCPFVKGFWFFTMNYARMIGTYISYLNCDT